MSGVLARLASKERRSLIAALFAALLAFGQLAPFLHALGVEHSTCAEHGELIEVKDAHAAHAAVPAAPADDAAVTAGREPPAPGAHVHDHCELALHGSPPAFVDGASALAVALHASVERPFALEAAWAPRAVLRLAPKTSPPRADA
ncbi:hypothetical protein L6R52_07170 [Myxococcota bacterium]|nr:hypothetical protein [Myxococcota bacterium]